MSKSIIDYKNENNLPDHLPINNNLIGVNDYTFYKKKKIIKVINKFFDLNLFEIVNSAGSFYMFLEDINHTKLYFIFDININKIDNELLGQFLEEMSSLPNFIDYKLSKYQLELVFYRNKIPNTESFDSISTLCDELDDIIII